MPSVLPLLPPQFQAVSALPPGARYRHFVADAARAARVWGLLDASGWVTLANREGGFGLPVWPHPAYARACATGPWAGCAPGYIRVHDFLDQWLPNMAALGAQVDVFPTPQGAGCMSLALDLELHLREELARNATFPLPAGPPALPHKPGVA